MPEMSLLCNWELKGFVLPGSQAAEAQRSSTLLNSLPHKKSTSAGSEKLVKSTPQLRDKSITNVEGRTQKEEPRGWKTSDK